MLHHYQQLHQTLDQLFHQLQTKAASETTTTADLKSDLKEVQQIQQQIMSSQLALTDEQAINFQAQCQPIQTEVTKQLRLLETDMLFLQTARQPATVQQHKQRINERLTLLSRYCGAILVLLEAELSQA